MGHETTVEHEVVCPCGKGTILTERTEYDNAWSPDGVVSRIECPACAMKYELVAQYDRNAKPGYALALIADTRARSALWGRRHDIGKLIERDYCVPVTERLIALARANEGRGGKRKAWHAALSRWAVALQLPPADGTWRLDTFVKAHVNRANVFALATDLGLGAGLEALQAELAELDRRLAVPEPSPLIWNGPPPPRG